GFAPARRQEGGECVCPPRRTFSRPGEKNGTGRPAVGKSGWGGWWLPPAAPPTRLFPGVAEQFRPPVGQRFPRFLQRFLGTLVGRFGVRVHRNLSNAGQVLLQVGDLLQVASRHGILLEELLYAGGVLVGDP